jgi:hypothetical protein
MGGGAVNSISVITLLAAHITVSLTTIMIGVAGIVVGAVGQRVWRGGTPDTRDSDTGAAPKGVLHASTPPARMFTAVLIASIYIVTRWSIAPWAPLWLPTDSVSLGGSYITEPLSGAYHGVRCMSRSVWSRKRTIETDMPEVREILEGLGPMFTREPVMTDFWVDLMPNGCDPEQYSVCDQDDCSMLRPNGRSLIVLSGDLWNRASEETTEAFRRDDPVAADMVRDWLVERGCGSDEEAVAAEAADIAYQISCLLKPSPVIISTPALPGRKYSHSRMGFDTVMRWPWGLVNELLCLTPAVIAGAMIRRRAVRARRIPSA